VTDGVELLVYHPEDEPIDYDRIREAKAMLGLEVRIRPVNAQPEDDGRVLAVGGRPPFLVDYFLISNGSTMDVVGDALGWALDLLDDERAEGVADTLTSLLGAPVHELTPAELESEARWNDYAQG
jgi:hypothetical protein